MTSHPVAQAIKKLLFAGQRGKGVRVADIRGAIAALNRELDDLAPQKANEAPPPKPSKQFAIFPGPWYVADTPPESKAYIPGTTSYSVKAMQPLGAVVYNSHFATADPDMAGVMADAAFECANRLNSAYALGDQRADPTNFL